MLIVEKFMVLICSLLSVRTFVGMSKLLTQCSRQILTTLAAISFVVRIA